MDEADLARQQDKKTKEVEQNKKKAEAELQVEQEKQKNIAIIEGKSKDTQLKEQVAFLRRQEGNQRLSDRKRLALKAQRVQKERELEQLRVRQTGEVFSNLSSLTESSNKTLFNIGKFAAVGTAVIQAQIAIQRSLAEGGPFLGPALAIAMGIKTAVQISKIKAQKLQRGIDFVPGVGNRDTVPALLTPGERVTPAETNRDLTSFLARNAENNALLGQIRDALGAISGSVQVNIGSKTIIDEVREGLEGGRMIEA